ncbi:hypothetical protein CLOM_g10856 [Closterium sp. NIES-68]|nr:hypothetical protein CLOM_g10856 [Closterium sp. NIES-68]GJP74813.1 hypothetical protein CLOP_g5347 [Closterium sp. NIES-67]GJP83026.1 hypothetical protein CLOP_g13237 [Closterium sp. NIES-67]
MVLVVGDGDDDIAVEASLPLHEKPGRTHVLAAATVQEPSVSPSGFSVGNCSIRGVDLKTLCRGAAWRILLSGGDLRICWTINSRARAVNLGMSQCLTIVAERRHDGPSPVVQHEARRKGASRKFVHGREEASRWFSILARARFRRRTVYASSD